MKISKLLRLLEETDVLGSEANVLIDCLDDGALRDIDCVKVFLNGRKPLVCVLVMK